jgi:L-threonylcarbamoyladenylate synthase
VALSPLKVFARWGPIVAMPNDPAEYARHLYAVLRELDGMKLHTIYVEEPPDRPEWSAVRDRLRRATVRLEPPPEQGV